MESDTILVPTDFSLPGNNAVKYAAAFANIVGRPMVLLNVCNMVDGSDAPEKNGSEADKRIADGKLERLREGLLRKFPGLKVSTLAVQGLPRETIMNTARELNAGMIIMGTTGRSKLSVTIFGSTTLYVIRNTPIPVLAVPGHVKWQIPRKIVYATDLKAAGKSLVRALIDFAAPFASQIELLHIDTPATSDVSKVELSRLKSNVEYKNIRTVSRINVDEVEGIEQYLHQSDVDILALAYQRRNILTQLFHFKVIKPLLSRVTFPILILRKSK